MARAKSKIDLEIMNQNSEKVAGILKSMSHPQRLLVLCLLADGELTVNELLEHCDLSQSHLSQVLNRLRLEGLIDSRKEGRSVYYQLKDDRIKSLITHMQKTFCKL